MEGFLTYLKLVEFGLLSGVILGISFAFTAPFLILRKNSLFPHALTHVLFFAIILTSAVASKVPALLQYPFTLLVAIGATVFIPILKRFKIYEDTATAIITHLFLGLGLIIAAKTSQYDAKLLSYLFGSIVGLTRQDFQLSIFLLLTTVLLFFKFYPLWLTQTTDDAVPGISFQWAGACFLFLVTFQILIGVKIMGILLVSVLFVFSGAVALRISKTFKRTVLLTGFLNVLGIFGGFLLSVYLDLPFSGGVVLAMLPLLGLIPLKKLFYSRRS